MKTSAQFKSLIIEKYRLQIILQTLLHKVFF